MAVTDSSATAIGTPGLKQPSVSGTYPRRGDVAAQPDHLTALSPMATQGTSRGLTPNTSNLQRTHQLPCQGSKPMPPWALRIITKPQVKALSQ